MLFVITVAIISGIMLGFRFKVLVLVPATLIAIALIIGVSVAGGYAIGGIVGMVLGAVVSLQIGYILGSVFGAIIATEAPSHGKVRYGGPSTFKSQNGCGVGA